jgi:adenosylmethionine-8-amino-7-oxononanoate aminotransferase
MPDDLTANYRNDTLVLGISDLKRLRRERPLVLAKGRGVFVFDENGRDYIEAVSSFYCVGLGYSDPELIEAAVAQKVLEIFERRDLLRHVRRIMPYWARAVAGLQAHPLVRATRTHGLLAGIDLDDPAAGAPATSLKVEGIAQAVYDAALDCGLIVRPLVGSLVLSPPLVITEAEIDELIRRLARALDLALAGRRAA